VVVEVVCYRFKLFHHTSLEHCWRVLGHLFYASFLWIGKNMELVLNLSCHSLAISYVVTVFHFYFPLGYVCLKYLCDLVVQEHFVHRWMVFIVRFN